MNKFVSNLNLLFVHEVNFETKVIFEMQEIPEFLAARGNTITYIDFPEGRRFWRRGNASRSRLVQGRTQPQVAIQLERPFTIGLPGLDRLLAPFAILPVLKKLFKNQKFDAIVLYAVPTYGPQVIYLAKRFGIPVIFRALDVSHKIRKTPFEFAIKVAESYIYKNVDLISANNPAMADYCIRAGSRTKPTAVHLPPLDLSHFASRRLDDRLQHELGIATTDIVITYLGTFFHFSGLDIVIKELASKLKTFEKVKLLLIGGGSQEHYLKKLATELNLDSKVIFTGFVPYAELSKFLALSTVAINPMQPGLVSNTAFPHKVIQYMASGIPVVSTRLEGLYKTFGENAGITWNYGPEGIVAKALELAQDPQKLSVCSKLGLEALDSKFDSDSAITNFEASIRELTK